GNTTVMMRFGIFPTGIFVISFIDAASIAETEFDPAFEMKHFLLSGVKVSQSGPRPTGMVAMRFNSGTENTETELSSKLFTQRVLPSGVMPIPCENVSGISGFAPAGASGSNTLLTTSRLA